MGTRYFLMLHCPYCNELNEDVYYAPSCDFYTHRCDFCDKEFAISMGFNGRKLEDMSPVWRKDHAKSEEIHDDH